MLDLAPGHLMVVCDDINLPFGTVRMRPKGSDGGHNGLGNIEETLGTRDYARIRIGIGNDFTQGGQIDFVLGEFGEEQQKELEAIFEKVSGGIRDWALAGIEKAMTALNTKPQSA
jgi:PTH1 family peptidyl-tRNA hydrolase